MIILSFCTWTKFCVWTVKGPSFLTALSRLFKDPIRRWFKSDVDLIFRDILVVSRKISHPSSGYNQYCCIIHRALSPQNTVLWHVTVWFTRVKAAWMLLRSNLNKQIIRWRQRWTAACWSGWFESLALDCETKTLRKWAALVWFEFMHWKQFATSTLMMSNTNLYSQHI